MPKPLVVVGARDGKAVTRDEHSIAMISLQEFSHDALDFK